MKNHPLSLGTRVLSIQGETSDTDDADGVFTGENVVGVVESADWYDGQGWTYGIAFPRGVFVFVSQSNGIDRDRYRYQILEN